MAEAKKPHVKDLLEEKVIIPAPPSIRRVTKNEDDKDQPNSYLNMSVVNEHKFTDEDASVEAKTRHVKG